MHECFTGLIRLLVDAFYVYLCSVSAPILLDALLNKLVFIKISRVCMLAQIEFRADPNIAHIDITILSA